MKIKFCLDIIADSYKSSNNDDRDWGDHFDGLVQDCSNSNALAMELWQSCTEPLILAWTLLTIYSLVECNLPTKG